VGKDEEEEVIHAKACPLCGTTSTQTRTYTMADGQSYTLRFWECIHYDPVDGHGVSRSAGPVEWRAARPDAPRSPA
jgi:hypothetical protein